MSIRQLEKQVFFVFFISALIVLTLSFSAHTQPVEGCPGLHRVNSSYNENHNQAVASCYINQVIGGPLNVALADELFTTDAVMHRPDGGVISGLDNIKRFLAALPTVYCNIDTMIQDIFAGGDRVAARLRHRVIHCEGAIFRTRIGNFPVGGMPLEWEPLTIFRFNKDGKIAEQWTQRDELGMLINLGILP